MLVFSRFQNFSDNVGRYFPRLGICFSTQAWIRWRSAELNFAGVAEMLSVGEPYGSAAGADASGVTLAEGRGGGEPNSQSMTLRVGETALVLVSGGDPPKERLKRT